MKKLWIVPGVALVALVAGTPAAPADQPPARTFVVVMTAAEEVPVCNPATTAARGVATFHVIDEAAGTVQYRVVANNLPGDITAAHIHFAPKGVAGPIVQPLALTLGEENGVIANGTFVNAALVDAIRANADNYYVNVHTGPLGVGCPPGVIRGQLGDGGPLNS
jgi:hypothetical protein